MKVSLILSMLMYENYFRITVEPSLPRPHSIRLVLHDLQNKNTVPMCKL